jgi:hypothetical protein
MFKTKLISQEGCFDKNLMTYYNGHTLHQIHWFPFVKGYKIRDLSKQKCYPTYYVHEEMVIYTRPNAKGQVRFKLQ